MVVQQHYSSIVDAGVTPLYCSIISFCLKRFEEDMCESLELSQKVYSV